jgi:hypothetical protein
MTDPETDRRFWELSADSRRLAATPDVGEPEVTRLAEILEEMQRILEEADPSIKAHKIARRYHGAGRAVDYVPKKPLEGIHWTWKR